MYISDGPCNLSQVRIKGRYEREQVAVSSMDWTSQPDTLVELEN